MSRPGSDPAGAARVAVGPIVDAHHHLWDLDRVEYPWQTPDVPIIYRNYEVDDLEPVLRASGVDATVIVQAADSFADTEYMLEAAASRDWLTGIVAWAPLADPVASERALERYAQLPKVKGIRHLISLEPDDDWLLRPAVLDSLRLLGERGLPFDVVAEKPRHLEVVLELAECVPGLRMVIDHLGKPDVKRQRLEPWERLIRACAEHEGIYAKVSGLNTAADWATWTATDLQPYVDVALDAFGVARCMFGSDWPVALKAGSYERVLRETARAVVGLSDHEREQFFGATAIEFYGLTV